MTKSKNAVVTNSKIYRLEKWKLMKSTNIIKYFGSQIPYKNINPQYQ
jgi:hypothetical protein